MRRIRTFLSYRAFAIGHDIALFGIHRPGWRRPRWVSLLIWCGRPWIKLSRALDVPDSDFPF